jgi:hypothetical protein
MADSAGLGIAELTIIHLAMPPPLLASVNKIFKNIQLNRTIKNLLFGVA